MYDHESTLTLGVIGNVLFGFLVSFLHFCVHGSLKGKER